jgi:hypothetical protein
MATEDRAKAETQRSVNIIYSLSERGHATSAGEARSYGRSDVPRGKSASLGLEIIIDKRGKASAKSLEELF